MKIGLVQSYSILNLLHGVLNWTKDNDQEIYEL